MGLTPHTNILELLEWFGGFGRIGGKGCELNFLISKILTFDDKRKKKLVF